MDSKYKIFSEQYNGLLDLVEMADEDLAKNYEKVIDSLPDSINDKLDQKKLFVCDGKDFRVILDKFDDQLYLEHTKYGKYLCSTVVLQPYYEEELEDPQNNEVLDIDKDGLFLFSLSFINTEDEPTTKLNYEEREGDYVFVDAKIDGVGINTEIFIKRKEGEFFLVSTKKFNDFEVYSKETKVKYSDLMACIAYEDENEYNNDG